MTAALCLEGYQRPNGDVVRCTYLAGHIGRQSAFGTEPRHSWFGVQAQDEADADKIDYTPGVLQQVLDAIVAGDCDAWLEAILAAAHTRKRALRGDRTTVTFRLQPPGGNDR